MILDASAVLALIFGERGLEKVEAAIEGGASISTANLSEVMARLVRDGVPPELSAATLAKLPVTVVPLDQAVALTAGAMFNKTRSLGLSLGDRICLALAWHQKRPALTADRDWATLGPILGVTVRLIR